MALGAVLTTCLQGGDFFLVNIGYAERPGPQGSYLLVKNEDGLVSSDPNSDLEKLPAVKVEGIVPALEEAYPYLEGLISVAEIEVDPGKLMAAGEIQVMGQVENAGKQPADTLSASIASAKPTAFGALTRIQVVRKQKSHVYDLKKQEHADAKLEPGDVVFVPMKKVIGR